MMNAAEIISSIEEMVKKIETLENENKILKKENENLTIEILNKDKQITSIKAERDMWQRIGSAANVTQQK